MGGFSPQSTRWQRSQLDQVPGPPDVGLCVLYYTILPGIWSWQVGTMSPSHTTLSEGFQGISRGGSFPRTGCCLVVVLARTLLDLNPSAQMTPLSAQGLWHPSARVWAALLMHSLWELARANSFS